MAVFSLWHGTNRSNEAEEYTGTPKSTWSLVNIELFNLISSCCNARDELLSSNFQKCFILFIFFYVVVRLDNRKFYIVMQIKLVLVVTPVN